LFDKQLGLLIHLLIWFKTYEPLELRGEKQLDQTKRTLLQLLREIPTIAVNFFLAGTYAAATLNKMMNEPISVIEKCR
jgi:hypothetical protein